VRTPRDLLGASIELQIVGMSDSFFDRNSLSLLHKPVNLVLCPFLLVSMVVEDIFALMELGIVELTHYCAIAIPGASFCVDTSPCFELLDPVDYETVAYGKLSVSKKMFTSAVNFMFITDGSELTVL
jgi:hypothetical protein